MTGHSPYRLPLLLLAAGTGALCGVVYELLLASLASYLLGSPVLVFSLTVGAFLASMGLGAFVSRLIHTRLLYTFVLAELALALVGGLAPLALFAVYTFDGPYLFSQGVATLLIGLLVGLELPLITRMLEQSEGLRVAIARALALDYLGALVGSVLFPLVLLPFCGVQGTAVLVGAGAAIVAAVVAWQHRQGLQHARVLTVVCSSVAVALLGSFFPARWAGDRLENKLYDAPVVARLQTPFQRIVLTRHRGDVRLFLDGDLQFSSVDEVRYHEALVHPGLSLHRAPKRVLLLGAGDGLALREIVKYPELEEVVLVELDPQMIKLARQHPSLRTLNQGSLDHKKVHVLVDDAFTRLAGNAAPFDRPFDVVFADFPDPDNETLARLYSNVFYGRVRNHLAPGGIFVTQASSPFYAPRAFFCIKRTLESVGFTVQPYLMDVPSFGPWGFQLATVGEAPDTEKLTLRPTTQHLTSKLAQNMFDLPADFRSPGPVEENRLLNPVLVRYHLDTRWAGYD